MAVGIFIDEFNTRRTMSFGADHRHIATREETFDQYTRREIFQKGHPQPTSFLYPLKDKCLRCVAGATYQIVEYLSSAVILGIL